MAYSGSRAKALGPGDEVGGHRLTRQIGEGGMGVVYLAEHKLMGRQAAIKVLLPIYSAEPELTSRFFNEARAATAIRHPGIVEIYDFGHQPDGSAYIVMEFLEGESLEARIKRLGIVSLGNTLHAARQIASALAAAHAKGIVHRDLKPDNIFLVPDRDMAAGERIKVLDFGIAKLTEADNATGSVKTRTGVVMGTPAYMAPEQCKGAGDVDHRADLYSLGCIMFEMLCGRAPFVAEGAGELIAKHIYEQPLSLTSLNPSVPEAVDIFVRRLLAKAPEQRCATSEELIAGLDHLIMATGAVPTAPSSHATMAAGGSMVGAPTPPPMPSHATPVPIGAGYSGGHGVPTPLPTAPLTGPPLAGATGPYAAPQTTLGVASVGTVALTTPPSPKSRKPLLIGGLLVAVLAVAGGAVVLGGGSESSEATGTAGATGTKASARTAPVNGVDTPVVKTPATKTPAVAATHAAHKAPDKAPVEKPKVEDISITIESTPTGASVFQQPQGIRVGHTPYTHSVAPMNGELVFTVGKTGYQNRKLVVKANANSQQAVVLKRVRRSSSSRRGPRTSARTGARTGKKPPKTTRPPKAPSTGRLNPFDPK